MKKLGVGPCPCCGVRIYDFRMPPIVQWDRHGGRINWRKKPVCLDNNGTTFWILQTDSSRMEVSICKDCILRLTDEIVKVIFVDIIYTKLSQIKGKDEKAYKLYDRIRTIEVWRWFFKEKDLGEYLEAHSAKEHSI